MRSYKRDLAFTILVGCLFTNLKISAYAQSMALVQPVQPIHSLPYVQSTESLKLEPIEKDQGVLTGEICSERVHELTADMPWFTDLHKAETRAKAENKLVLWIHMVGKIDGAT